MHDNLYLIINTQYDSESGRQLSPRLGPMTIKVEMADDECCWQAHTQGTFLIAHGEG